MKKPRMPHSKYFDARSIYVARIYHVGLRITYTIEGQTDSTAVVFKVVDVQDAEHAYDEALRFVKSGRFLDDLERPIKPTTIRLVELREVKSIRPGDWILTPHAVEHPKVDRWLRIVKVGSRQDVAEFVTTHAGMFPNGLLVGEADTVHGMDGFALYAPATDKREFMQCGEVFAEIGYESPEVRLEGPNSR